MKKIITTTASSLLLLAAFALPTSCITIPENIDSEELESKIYEVQAKAIDQIHEALDQPLLVISQTGDTVVAYMPDSVAEGTAVRKITVHVDEAKEDIRPYLADKQRQLIMAISAIIVPCVTVLLIAAAIMIFIFVRNRNRNALIEKAIENGYELPESFYSGQNTTRVIYQNAPTQPGQEATENAGQPTPSTGSAAPYFMPPIPPTPPTNSKNLQSGIKLAVIGFCILIFFLIVESPSVAILAGGIPLLLGIGRIASWYYLDKNRKSATNHTTDNISNHLLRNAFNCRRTETDCPMHRDR